MRKHLFLLALACALPALASADTYGLHWSGLQPDLNFSTAGGKFTATLNDAMVTIHYRATLQEVDSSGTVVRELSCGDTVPEGTRVRLGFDAHKFTDISWFGTGGSTDSPYGMWLPFGTQPSPANRCEPDNLYKISARKANLYAELSIEPPEKAVSTNMQDCSTGSDGSQTCILSAGTFEATYTFAATRGSFWGGWRHTAEEDAHVGDNQCYAPSRNYRGVDQKPMRSSGSPYTVIVPQKTFDCALTVVPADGEAPEAPALSAGAACTAGVPLVITMQATDPDGDDIRYLVDWNNDGTTDQVVPASGYVPSGTAQTASRTFSVAGNKTIKVRAQDSKGFSSASKSLAVTCASEGDSATAALNADDTGGTGFDVDASSGANTADLSLRVRPSLVKIGATTKVHWSSQNMSSCRVSATNGDVWDGLRSPVNGETSGAITGETTYTLSCTGRDGTAYEKTVKVNIIPSWKEQ